jgi:hypothetical protein
MAAVSRCSSKVSGLERVAGGGAACAGFGGVAGLCDADAGDFFRATSRGCNRQSVDRDVYATLTALAECSEAKRDRIACLVDDAARLLRTGLLIQMQSNGGRPDASTRGELRV